MPKYLFQVSYTNEGTNGLLQVGGSHRAKAVDDVVASVGGTVECFYYAFGEDDAFVIAELPDDIAATALSLRVASAGTATVKTTVLIEPKTIDAAVNRNVDYKPAKS
jgi:uncharacterized protein with GYD domain